jgi:hypothetical protein
MAQEAKRVGMATSPGLPPVEEAAGGAAAWDYLALLRQVQASLARSRGAVLAANLGTLWESTAEQARLSLALETQMRLLASRPTRIFPSGKPLETTADISEDRWDREIRASLLEIRAASRLQLALLRRMQHKLRVLANTLAGQSRDYGPSPASGSPQTVGLRSPAQGSRKVLCQV